MKPGDIRAIYVLSSIRPNQAPNRYAVNESPNERRGHVIKIDFERGSDLDAYRVHFDDGLSVQVRSERVPRVEYFE